ncbi:hypothetical protein CR492_07870 [Methylocella silvestris]|uniref:Uncharacterized protein n=1 Tax=Methylocella silvestris TaxID=199596 RepID=A0A2J7TIJ0_METSI|nr:hypothetical protein CR492_07870 [Methylocella silvestris]
MPVARSGARQDAPLRPQRIATEDATSASDHIKKGGFAGPMTANRKFHAGQLKSQGSARHD